ncbi:MAG: response regulator [Ignavibacteriales bacterium]|nr:response regulator [Ignavibacteriales bacterium]
MERDRVINVLLVEDNADFAKLVRLYLTKYGGAKFEVDWSENGKAGIERAGAEPHRYDVILMDYFLPGLNGLEVTRMLQEKNVTTPVVFLTVNKDVNLAVEVMKLGVEDYLVKEEVSTPILPKTILGVVEKRVLQGEMAELEIRKKRLEAMQEMIEGITHEVESPLNGMKMIVEGMLNSRQEEKTTKYLSIIKENIDRIQMKLEKLKNLKEDRTVQYIKDIRMIDLS